eukprot:TRINITY_DN9961_c0_g1_i1.p1 TRINITY_DN9961_c0_g1~~TRINITY_DN9961_c0_g1_i1.p1  ORF type:complete len:250 (-),score=65.46 TRINITY_DN9961_c0_g1_i1:26-775(-)
MNLTKQKVDRAKAKGAVANDFLPEADYRTNAAEMVPATMESPPCGGLELMRLSGCTHAYKARHGYYNQVEKAAQGERFRASPHWLRGLSSMARMDFEGDLWILKEKFGLASAEIVQLEKHGLPAGLAVDISGSSDAVGGARQELLRARGIFEYYAAQVEWSAAEMPTLAAEPPEPPAQAAAPPPHAHRQRHWAPPPREVPNNDWGSTPVPDADTGDWNDAPSPPAAEAWGQDDDWGDGSAPDASPGQWD